MKGMMLTELLKIIGILANDMEDPVVTQDSINDIFIAFGDDYSKKLVYTMEGTYVKLEKEDSNAFKDLFLSSSKEKAGESK